MVFELNEDFVEVAEVTSVAFGLYGQVLIGDVGENFQSRGEGSGKLQVEIGIQDEVLVVADGYTS